MRKANGIVALILCAALPAQAASLWKDGGPTTLTDRRALHPGDLVTVIIVENASGSNSASAATSKENKLGGTGLAGTGIFKLLKAFSASDNTKNEFTGSGQADVSTKLTARLTARVVGVDSVGNLKIEGTRTVAVNHDQEEMVLTASVRPDDIHGDNTVLSTYLADAVIGYRGHGPNALAQHQGLVSRILNWIF